MRGGSPVRPGVNGVTISVRLTPKAAKTAILGIREDAAGQASLAVAVTAAPEAGRANEALIRCLAKAWGLAPSRIRLLSGATSRVKTLAVSGSADELMAALQTWIVELKT